MIATTLENGFELVDESLPARQTVFLSACGVGAHLITNCLYPDILRITQMPTSTGMTFSTLPVHRGGHSQ